MRLDKLLANMGYGTRKECRQLLKAGLISVNGRVEKDGSKHVQPEIDTILCQGEEVLYKPFIYLMLNKPAGVISATEDSRETTVLELLEEQDARYEPFPAGRLDKDTEGLLLLTNDGKLAHQLLSPKNKVPKTYYVEVAGVVDERDQQAFKQGVTLEDGYVCLPADLEIRESGANSTVLLTIVEGKFHQVKRMFLARGKKVTYLKRLQMGSLQLDETLPKGAYRELTEEEISMLQTWREEHGE